MQEMQETLVRSWVKKDPLEYEMATHCSIFDWIIPCREEVGGPQSRGSQKSQATEQMSTAQRISKCVAWILSTAHNLESLLTTQKTYVSLRLTKLYATLTLGFPVGSAVRNLPASTGDPGSISGSGRSPGGGNNNPLQCFCPKNPMDRGAWWATIHGATKKLAKI